MEYSRTRYDSGWLDNMDIIKKAKIESSTVIIVSKLVHIQETLKLNVEEL